MMKINNLIRIQLGFTEPRKHKVPVNKNDADDDFVRDAGMVLNSDRVSRAYTNTEKRVYTKRE